MSVTRSATVEGTRSFAHRLAPNVLGKTGFYVSPIGFGGYRIHPGIPEHRAALENALGTGCNLIDTSSNYGDGGSETLIGEVLRRLFATGRLTREQIVVVTKAGYVQGSNLKLARQRMERGLGFQEMVEYTDDCWHCISPQFLQDQITRSLSRLGLDRIDVLLLHNPEYFLKTSQDHTEYYRRIGEALKYLETEVTRGRIQYYGISSNSFPAPKESEDFTSLEAIHDFVRENGCEHFAVVEFPFNLYEPDAALEENNGGKTLFEAARAWGLGTLINRPLNAFYGEKLIRLADFRSHPEKDVAEKDVEGSLKDSFLKALQIESDYAARDILPAKEVAWAHILQHHFEKISGIDAWRSILEHQIEPALESIEAALSGHVDEWLAEYRSALEELFTDITDYFEELAALLSERIKGVLDQACPTLASSPTLSRKALRVERSIPGASSVLVGMRKPEYVLDALSPDAPAMDPPLTPDEAMSALSAIQSDLEHGAGTHDHHETQR